jgi:aspartate aminotransferase
MREEFDRRRRAVVAALGRLPGVELAPPEGAFYVFPRVDALFGSRSPGGAAISDSASFCDAVLNEALVAIVPGAAFGDDRCFRLSYAASMPQLEQGLARLDRFLAGVRSDAMSGPVPTARRS